MSRIIEDLGGVLKMQDHGGFLMDEPTWAQRVKTVRLRLNLTQDQLATRLEISPASIAAWEFRSHRPYSAEAEKFLKLEAEVLGDEEPS